MGIEKKIKGYLKSEVLQTTSQWIMEFPLSTSNFHFSVQFAIFCSSQPAGLQLYQKRALAQAPPKDLFFVFQNRDLSEHFKKPPPDTLGLVPKDMYSVTVFTVSNYGNSIITFRKSPFKNNIY